MYGYLQLSRKKIYCKETYSYQQAYCGQCASLHKHFGYAWRAAVSYDAAFLGLLMAAQQEKEPAKGKSWCGMFPRRISVSGANEQAQDFSAAFAVMLFSMKLKDRQDEKSSRITAALLKACDGSFGKAEGMLREMGFPLAMIQQTLHSQQLLESSDSNALEIYAEPTALFLAEAMRFSAIANGKPENAEPLFQIGRHLGRIIYIVDSCVDIDEDIDTKSFNALLKSFPDDATTVAQKSQDRVPCLILESLQEIKTLTREVTLTRHKDIIDNILLYGLPAIIFKRVTRSIKKLEKTNLQLLRYLPHTALAAALCLCSAEQAEASACLWNERPPFALPPWRVYGCNCAPSDTKFWCEPCGLIFTYIDCLINPLACYKSTASSEGTCICCVQLPKTIVEGAIVGGLLRSAGQSFYNSAERNHREKENQRRVALAQSNQNFLDNSLNQLNLIENEIIAISAKISLPQQISYGTLIQQFVSRLDRERQNYASNKELNQLIVGINQRTSEDRVKLAAAEPELQCVKALFENVQSTVMAKGSPALIAETRLAEMVLKADFIQLLANRRWSDFDDVLNNLKTYLADLQARALI